MGPKAKSFYHKNFGKENNSSPNLTLKTKLSKLPTVGKEEEAKKITFSEPLAREEFKRMARQELREYPYSQAILGLFRSLWQSDNLKIARNSIMSNIPSEFGFSMELKTGYESLELEIWNSPIDEIPAPGWLHVGVRKLAQVSGQIEDAGVWTAAKGEAKKEILRVEIKPLYLPSKAGRWLLETLTNFARGVSEHYQPLSEQPHFWQRDPGT